MGPKADSKAQSQAKAPAPTKAKTPSKALDDDLVMNLVQLALACSPEERLAYVRTACNGNAELLEEVWKYIEREQRMKGFLLEPLYPPQADAHIFQPGELLDARFRIVRQVGEGGMGTVYEAVDEKLDRRVAIKCAKAGFHKQLPPEVRHARDIGHPNVCKIFEIHTATVDGGKIDFITMEFLDGETLSERLHPAQRVPRLPESEALTIARQICTGLAEAHRNGVIHGDLKSNNIILTKAPDGAGKKPVQAAGEKSAQATRAVITDFGLARRLETTPQTVQSGSLRGGAPDYMAPELWKGEKASTASDVYALGVILYELFAGRRPYSAPASWMETNTLPSKPGAVVKWEDRLTRKPQPANPKWDKVLMRCLEPDPAKRFRDAGEVAKAIAPRAVPRKLVAAAGVVLAVVTGIVTYERATAPKETVRLAVLPFESDSSIAPGADGLFRETAKQVGRIRSNARTKFGIVSSSSKATHTLRGTLARQNENLLLHVYVTDTPSGANAKDWQAVYAPNELRYVPVALAGVVTATFHLPLLANPATVNGAALQDYLKGMAAVRYDSRVNEALADFQRAVAADPDSPLTWAGLAEAEWFKYSEREGIWLERSTESERQAEKRNPDLAAVHRVLALLLFKSGRYDDAVAHSQRAIELEPGNSDGYRRLATAYEANNQISQALVEYRRAAELEPRYYRNEQGLGSFYLAASDYAAAIQHYRKAVQIAPGEPQLHYGLGIAYRDSGEYAKAESEFQTAIGSRPQEAPLPVAESIVLLNALGVTLMYEREERQAIPYFLEALDLAPERYLLWMNLGICYRRTGLLEKSGYANKRGIEAAELEIARNPRDAVAHSVLAYLSARTGDQGRARSEVAVALQLAPNNTHILSFAAETQEALNDRDATIQLLSGAPGGLLADLGRFPDLAELQKDDRFQRLLTSKHVK
jgi:serine/threonine protein kinase/Flp pilus assembly protein TadD